MSFWKKLLGLKEPPKRDVAQAVSVRTDVSIRDLMRDLESAVKRGDLEKAKAIFKEEPDLLVHGEGVPDTQFDLVYQASGAGQQGRGRTPGDKNMVKLLLDNKAGANFREAWYDSDQPSVFVEASTPLLVWVEKGDKDVVALLLANGADVNATNGDSKQTPLHVAAAKGDRDMVELLLANKADVNAKEMSGYTPLRVAVSGGHKAVIELLLARKANVNAKEGDGGWTPFALGGCKGRQGCGGAAAGQKSRCQRKGQRRRDPFASCPCPRGRGTRADRERRRCQRKDQE